ncbi:MAG: molybdenum cofactor guanylyltransferase [Terriglobales bacterium]|jgi:molybdopterin-guanine dinucleotide biosynthesis protein A
MTDSPQLSRAGFLLAGGKSSRMGANKAFLDFAGQPLLDRTLGVLNAACGRVTIVGDPSTFANFAPVVADVFPGCGPLGGIHAALLNSPAELNVMLAVDMPFVSAELLSLLFAAAAKTQAIVTVPRTGRGLQPLCAVYRREFAAAAEHALRAGKYKVDAAYAAVPLRIVEERELVAAGFSDKNFLNLNTPEDRRAAEDLASQP